MEIKTINEIREKRDSIREKIKSLNSNDYSSETPYGAENEYTFKGVIVGIDSFNQLKDLIKISQLKQAKLDWSFMKSNDRLLVDPNNWALF